MPLTEFECVFKVNIPHNVGRGYGVLKKKDKAPNPKSPPDVGKGSNGPRGEPRTGRKAASYYHLCPVGQKRQRGGLKGYEKRGHPKTGLDNVRSRLRDG